MAFRAGRKNLLTDVAGLAVGNVTDDRIRTGVTLLDNSAPGH